MAVLWSGCCLCVSVNIRDAAIIIRRKGVQSQHCKMYCLLENCQASLFCLNHSLFIRWYKGSDTIWFVTSISASGLSRLCLSVAAPASIILNTPASARPLPLTPRDVREANNGPMRAQHWTQQPIRGQMWSVTAVCASSTPVAAMLHPSSNVTV